ncbi:MAG: OmpA family protein [Sulfurimonas sp.]|nr:OmpA family protein [Sulfurimonas sp.]
MKYLFTIIIPFTIYSLNAIEINEKNFPFILPISVEKMDTPVDIQATITEIENEENEEKYKEVNQKEEPLRATILDVDFEVSKSTILSKSLEKIDELAQLLKENKEYQLVIYSYTDNTGSNNKVLSKNRAKAIKKALTNRGIRELRLTAIGMGSKNPLVDNDTPENRAINRRIEIDILE